MRVPCTASLIFVVLPKDSGSLGPAMTEPELPSGHSFFAYGECPNCSHAPSVRHFNRMSFSEVLALMKLKMRQHMLVKHHCHTNEADQVVRVFSARRYWARRRVEYEDVAEESTTDPAPARAQPQRIYPRASARMRSRSPAREPEPERGHDVDVHAAQGTLDTQTQPHIKVNPDLSDLSGEELFDMLIMVGAEFRRRTRDLTVIEPPVAG